VKYLLSIVLLSFHVTCVFAQTQEEVVAKFVEARNSIRTLSCTVHIHRRNTGNPQIPDEEFAEVVSEGKILRIRHKMGTMTNDIYVASGVVNREDRDSHYTDIRKAIGTISNKDMPHSCDPWSYGLFTVAGVSRHSVPLEELLADPKCEITSFGAVQATSPIKFSMGLKQPRIKMEVTFDTGHRFLVSEIKYIDEKRTVFHAVEKFGEPSPGIFFPSVVSSKIQGTDSSWTTTFSNVKINKPLPAGAFDFKFTPGMLVADMIRNDFFRTNANGDPVLPAKNERGDRITLSDSAPVPVDTEKQPKSEAATLEERPNRSGTWIATVSILFIVTGIGIFYRRRRQSRE
jgi:hypothetical protein